MSKRRKKNSRKKGSKVVRQVPYELRELSEFQQKMYVKMTGRWGRSNARRIHGGNKGNRRKP